FFPRFASALGKRHNLPVGFDGRASYQFSDKNEAARAASAVTVPSGTLHITNLHVDSKFVIVAEVNDVVAAVAGASGTTQALSTDRKQKRLPTNRYVRIINRGFDNIHREI